MKRLLTTLLASGSLVGCGTREQAAVPVELPVVIVENTSMTPDPVPTPAALTPAAVQPPAPKPPEPPSVFEYPSDLTGQAVAKSVSPAAPALPTPERFGVAPLPRKVPAKVQNPEPTVKTAASLPAIAFAPLTSVALTPPRERVPFDLGAGAEGVPARPALPVAAAISERARDVSLPPAMPTLGRPLHERTSLEDPTSEFANAAVASPAVNVPLGSAPFVKVSLPDPFELGDQVKPKVPPAAEPGLQPAPVNPQRVK